MKRIIFAAVIILTVFASIPGMQQTLSADANYSIRTGLNFTPGLVYNRSWDPAYNGSAATISLVRESGMLMLAAGAEAGYSYTGFNLLFPIQAGLILVNNDSLSFSAAASIMPGLILGRPEQYFLFATEITGILGWMINDNFSLGLSVGPRYTTSPAYSKAVAALELIDINIGLSADFRLGD